MLHIYGETFARSELKKYPGPCAERDATMDGPW